MARKPGFASLAVLHHVLQRGNNREPCFYANRIPPPLTQVSGFGFMRKTHESHDAGKIVGG